MRKVIMLCFCVTLLMLTSCSNVENETRESEARELLEDGLTFMSGIQEVGREIKYTVKKRRHKINETAVIYENTKPVIEISVKKAKGQLYPNSVNKYDSIEVEMNYKNIDYPKAFEISFSGVELFTMKGQAIKHGANGMESTEATLGTQGHATAALTIGELIEIGDSVIIRYDYDIEVNGGGAGPFDYIEFEVPIEVVKK
ncbi:hypothetical protein A5821_001121 [Enterococcus sp. 7F3_DIV0205]|uniref:DUF4352 domain-containing protein n=1 Tax=Candidatus Enterococcus palustris TaxID=1834189 RepID=A0AAQ3Y5D7_9ENTE|nr:hypothetical protein [Enterococcus sp. 7F3_DIV0205]OTN85518.1 hypothetical protein A5821_001464 [Enterococcus sp. 7F3_DIV0205]